MKCKAIKAFSYSHDGVSVRRVAKNECVEIRDALVEGLAAAGCVERPSPKAASKPSPQDPPTGKEAGSDGAPKDGGGQGPDGAGAKSA